MCRPKSSNTGYEFKEIWKMKKKLKKYWFATLPVKKKTKRRRVTNIFLNINFRLNSELILLNSKFQKTSLAFYHTGKKTYPLYYISTRNWITEVVTPSLQKKGQRRTYNIFGFRFWYQTQRRSGTSQAGHMPHLIHSSFQSEGVKNAFWKPIKIINNWVF